METLRALDHHKILRKAEYRLLSEGYLFLRRLDHRLRLQRDQSIDIVEREPDQLHGVAQVLGYKRRAEKKAPGELLLRDYELRRERIRACYNRYFQIGGAKTEEEEKRPGSGNGE